MTIAHKVLSAHGWLITGLQSRRALRRSHRTPAKFAVGCGFLWGNGFQHCPCSIIYRPDLLTRGAGSISTQAGDEILKGCGTTRSQERSFRVTLHFAETYRVFYEGNLEGL
ncbi:MAG: hypothetical protein ACM3PY_14300 [Omnitrophica WOR_2 bacterium]